MRKTPLVVIVGFAMLLLMLFGGGFVLGFVVSANDEVERMRAESDELQRIIDGRLHDDHCERWGGADRD